jgi:hypothetical protein
MFVSPRFGTLSIDGVDEGFFERRERVIDETVGLGAILWQLTKFQQRAPFSSSAFTWVVT